MLFGAVDETGRAPADIAFGVQVTQIGMTLKELPILGAPCAGRRGIVREVLVKEAMRAALAKVEGVVKGAVKIIARLTYRQRYAQSTGRDPCICPHGGHEMGVWRIWHPTYGVIHDEGEVIKRGTYASSAQRAGP